MLACIVLIRCFCYASSVCFGSSFVWLCQRLLSLTFLQEDNCKHRCLCLQCISPFVLDFVHFLTFWHHMIQTWILMHNVCWLFCALYMLLWFRSGRISSVEGIWLGIPLTQSFFISRNFFTTVSKIIYAACSIQAGRIFIGQNWHCQVHDSSCAFRGGVSAPFPNSSWYIEPMVLPKHAINSDNH